MCENLIDLTDLVEEKELDNLQHQQPLISSIISISNSNSNSDVSSNFSLSLRRSFDNNPFDSMQKMVGRQDDPFDIVEKEACAKALKAPSIEVKVAKLLSIEDCDSLCGEVQQNHSNCEESHPVSITDNVTPDSGACSTDGDGSGGTDDSKCKRSTESRKRLLKLSITNSTFNTPLTRYNSHQAHRETFPDGESCYSPIPTAFSETAAQCVERMIDVESPLKLVEDDLLAEEPPSFLDSDKDFEADLEMLAIPMLKQLPSVSGENSKSTPLKLENTGVVEELSQAAKSETSLSVNDVFPDLVALRSKLNARRKNKAAAHNSCNSNSPDFGGDNQDVTQLILHLKTLISDIDIGDDSKKQQATSLLDFLSSALNSDIETAQTSETLPVPQQSIVRQGTFDMDLKQKEKDKNEVPEQNSVQEKPMSNLGIENIPEAMIKSSATYDCETPEEKDDLQLPETAYTRTPPAAQPEVNDLVQQLSKLLEQNFLNSQQSHHNNHSSNNYSNGFNYTSDDGSIPPTSTSAINPTFIVVMPPPGALPSYMIPSRNGSPELQSSCAVMRRRSQSLSLHDKLKILQLPQQPITPSLNINASPSALSPSTDAAELKTPVRSIPRRNSFSSGTPYTPSRINSSTVRRSAVSSDLVPKMSTNFARSSSALSTHAEGKPQQHHVVRPMPQGNLNVFKPDLKKKTRTSSSANSILKSTGPMKATIPIKRVAPMMKVPLASPDNGNGGQLHTKSVAGLMPAPKTVGMSGTYPIACSTPTAFNRSPLKRPNTVTNKSRYSIGARATASSTPLTASTSTNSKRRSLLEPKAKSPTISRRQSCIGSVGGTAKPTTGKATTYVGRTPSKPLPMSSSYRGMTPHRTGSNTSSLAGKSKENKKP